MKKNLFVALLAALVPMVLVIVGGFGFDVYANYIATVLVAGCGIYASRNEVEYESIALVSGFFSSMVAMIYIGVGDFFEASFFCTAFAVLYFSVFAWFMLYLYRNDCPKDLMVCIMLFLGSIDLAAVFTILRLLSEMCGDDAGGEYILIGVIVSICYLQIRGSKK